MHKHQIPIRGAAFVILLASALSCSAPGTAAESGSVPPADTAPCMGAIAAQNDDQVLSQCGTLIDNDKAAKADRIKALIARAGVFARRDDIDRAIADDDMVLRLDPSLADVFNGRGELWWKKGDRPRAVADFAAALKLNPDHAAARANTRRLALELERLGALMAVYGKPSFNCAGARRPVEKAICANGALADLDREINAASIKAVREAAAESPRAGRELQRRQEEFLAQRDASFGKPGYDLQKAMRERLDQLLAVARQ